MNYKQRKFAKRLKLLVNKLINESSSFSENLEITYPLKKIPFYLRENAIFFQENQLIKLGYKKVFGK